MGAHSAAELLAEKLEIATRKLTAAQQRIAELEREYTSLSDVNDELQSELGICKQVRNAVYVDGFGIFSENAVVRLLEKQAELAEIKGKREWAYQASDGGCITHCEEIPARHWCDNYAGYVVLSRYQHGPWEAEKEGE